jgi:hypothetical protein
MAPCSAQMPELSQDESFCLVAVPNNLALPEMAGAGAEA